MTINNIFWENFGKDFYNNSQTNIGITSYANFENCIVDNTIQFFVGHNMTPTKFNKQLFVDIVDILVNEKCQLNSVESALDFWHYGE